MHCYLDEREGSPNWYIYQYDERTGQCQRISTRTADREAAEKKLAEHVLSLPQRQALRDATLIHVLLRYWQHHGKNAFATSPIRRVMGLVSEHEPSTLLCDWSIQRQKEFVAKIHGKPSTKRRYMGVIGTAVQWSFDNGEITALPAILRVAAEDGEGARPFEINELRALFSAAAHEHHRRFLLLCVSAAPRPGASLDITWDRIGKSGVADFIVPGRRKTKKRRARVALPATAHAYLEARRSVGPVIQWRGKQMKGHKMTFMRIAARAGVTGTAYGIRKAVSIWLRTEGVPEWDAKGMLGHTIGGTTERYAHYRPEYMRAAAASVERLLREICPVWLASYLPVSAAAKSQVAVAIGESGGSYPIRTDDQFLKREEIHELFRVLEASNDD